MQKLEKCKKKRLYDAKTSCRATACIESCYANWEQGRTEPNIGMLRKLGTILNVSIDELINGDTGYFDNVIQ